MNTLLVIAGLIFAFLIGWSFGRDAGRLEQLAELRRLPIRDVLKMATHGDTLEGAVRRMGGCFTGPLSATFHMERPKPKPKRPHLRIVR